MVRGRLTGRVSVQSPGPGRALLSDIGRFLVSGGVTVVFDVGTLVGLTALGAPLSVATTTAFFAALAVNFLVTRLLLGSRSVLAVHHQFRRYLVLLAINYAITITLVLGASQLGVHYLLGKGVAVAATAAVSFVAYRSWVFA